MPHKLPVRYSLELGPVEVGVQRQHDNWWDNDEGQQGTNERKVVSRVIDLLVRLASSDAHFRLGHAGRGSVVANDGGDFCGRRPAEGARESATDRCSAGAGPVQRSERRVWATERSGARATHLTSAPSKKIMVMG